MVTPEPGVPPDMAVRADIEIPERRIIMTLLIRRNTKQMQQATSHTIEITFNPRTDFPFGGISNVPGVLMKQAEQTRGSPLGGAAVKITSNYFLIGLSAVETDTQRNMQLLKERSWFDIPIVYKNGRRAILAIEKGTSGERALEEAFKAWEQTSADPAPLPAPRIPPEAGQRHNDPWMRGITLPTSVHREMKVSVYSRHNVGQVRMMMIKPVTSLPMTFGADPYGGMQTLKFAGASSGVFAPSPAPALPPLTAAGRVALYEEGPSDKKGKRFVGSVIWRTEMWRAETGSGFDPAIRADVTIPERHISISLLILRDLNQAQQATSHSIEINFDLPSDLPFGFIQNVPAVLMKQGEQMRGSPLRGATTQLTSHFFLIGLSAVEKDRRRNVQLMREHGWFDIAIVYNNGHRATLTIEKSTSGERVFQEAFKIWDGPSPGQPADITVPKGVQTLPSQSAPSGAYVVQVSEHKTEDEARASYRALQQKYPSVLGGREANLSRADGDYRVQIGPFATEDQANSFCSDLKFAGVPCIVQRPERREAPATTGAVYSKPIQDRLTNQSGERGPKSGGDSSSSPNYGPAPTTSTPVDFAPTKVRTIPIMLYGEKPPGPSELPADAVRPKPERADTIKPLSAFSRAMPGMQDRLTTGPKPVQDPLKPQFGWPTPNRVKTQTFKLPSKTAADPKAAAKPTANASNGGFSLTPSIKLPCVGSFAPAR